MEAITTQKLPFLALFTGLSATPECVNLEIKLLMVIINSFQYLSDILWFPEAA